MDLQEIRQEINKIDDELVRLFVRRMQAAEAVAEVKRAIGAPVKNPLREREILAKVAQAAGPELENEARLLFTTLMAMSRGRQRAELSREDAVVRQNASSSAESVRRSDVIVGIRGRGLIGGSFEKAFAAAGHEVVDLKDATRETIGRCGLVIVCLPPLMVAPWIVEHAGDFADGALVTDAAGVKGGVCPLVEPVARGARWTYVGGHPMAGKERSGYANADADLFCGASMIFTPFAGTDPAVLERLKALFAEVGFARFVITDPTRHDEMIAYTSQLAHVVSSAYVRDPLAAAHVGFSAGSYQDMTRVATVDPDIWTDLLLANRVALESVLTRLLERLDGYRAALHAGDAPMLRALLADGRRTKEQTF